MSMLANITADNVPAPINFYLRATACHREWPQQAFIGGAGQGVAQKLKPSGYGLYIFRGAVAAPPIPMHSTPASGMHRLAAVYDRAYTNIGHLEPPQQVRCQERAAVLEHPARSYSPLHFKCRQDLIARDCMASKMLRSRSVLDTKFVAENHPLFLVSMRTNVKHLHTEGNT